LHERKDDGLNYDRDRSGAVATQGANPGGNTDA